MAVEVPHVPASADGLSSILSFTLNGEPVTIQNPDPTTLLVEYLRSPEVGLTGTKLVCGEGGCGACTVLVTRIDPNTTQVVERAVNACLHPLCSLDGAAVTTVEATGSTRTTLSPVQKAMVTEAGTQCGFCTPGWVMNMEGLLRSGVSLTAQTIEDHFDGNLCRCTGMRPILNAMQTFAGWTPPAPPAPPPPSSTPQPLHFRGSGYDWYRPLTLEETRALLYVGKATYATAKLVNGNTSVAIYKRDVEDPQLLVDISSVPELTGSRPGERHRRSRPEPRRAGGIPGGQDRSAAVDGDSRPPGAARPHPPDRQRAGAQRRHHRRQPDDDATERRNQRSVPVRPLHRPRDARSDGRACSPATRRRTSRPCPSSSSPTSTRCRAATCCRWLTLPLTRPQEYVKTYKVARRVQNAHALVNAGFRVRFDSNGKCRGRHGRPRRHRRDAAGGRRLVAGRQGLGLVDVAASGSRRSPPRSSQSLVPMPDGVSDEYRAQPRRQPRAQVLRLARIAGQRRRSSSPNCASAGEDYVRPVSSGTTALTSYPRRMAGRRGDPRRSRPTSRRRARRSTPRISRPAPAPSRARTSTASSCTRPSTTHCSADFPASWRRCRSSSRVCVTSSRSPTSPRSRPT